MRAPLSRPATAAFAAVAAIVAASPVTHASAPTVKTLYVAPSGNDTDNTCTARATPCQHLYYAIHNAGTYTGDAVALIAAAGTYTENDEIDIPALASLTIKAVPGTVAVEGRRRTHASVFTIDSSTVTFQGLTITDGDADRGGGINNFGGTVTLTHSAITDNTARYTGGGVEELGERGDDPVDITKGVEVVAGHADRAP